MGAANGDAGAERQGVGIGWLRMYDVPSSHRNISLSISASSPASNGK
jgi:hypothetical protein